MIRISKFLSDSGIASRRGAEKMIEEGRVGVNGKTISTPVVFVAEKDAVSVDGKDITAWLSSRGLVVPAKASTESRIYLFHKPAGCICSAKDPEGRRTIYDILPPEYRNLKYAGRLDYNTSGLLLLTNDGDLARKMTLPESGLERVYIAKVGGAATMDDAMFARITKPVVKGVKIDGIIYRPMKLERLNASDVRIAVAEGRKNEIRIVFEHIGLPIRKLHRISYGEFELGALPPGKITAAARDT